jgi:hypothetical protein
MVGDGPYTARIGSVRAACVQYRVGKDPYTARIKSVRVRMRHILGSYEEWNRVGGMKMMDHFG